MNPNPLVWGGIGEDEFSMHMWPFHTISSKNILVNCPTVGGCCKNIFSVKIWTSCNFHKKFFYELNVPFPHWCPPAFVGKKWKCTCVRTCVQSLQGPCDVPQNLRTSQSPEALYTHNTHTYSYYSFLPTVN